MTIFIKGPFITIGQLLKKMGIITSGGQAKFYVANNVIKINNSTPKGKNAKVLVGSIVQINDDLYHIVPKIE